jgi:hypothetical protein
MRNGAFLLADLGNRRKHCDLTIKMRASARMLCCRKYYLYLFRFYVFNYAVSNLDERASNGRLVNNEMEGMREGSGRGLV